MENVLSLIETARMSGKLKRGINEVTKAVERGIAKTVAVATDASPKELILHLKPLCEEKGITYSEAGSKEELGAAAGIKSATAVAILDEGKAGRTPKEEDKDGE